MRHFVLIAAVTVSMLLASCGASTDLSAERTVSAVYSGMVVSFPSGISQGNIDCADTGLDTQSGASIFRVIYPGEDIDSTRWIYGDGPSGTGFYLMRIIDPIEDIDSSKFTGDDLIVSGY